MSEGSVTVASYSSDRHHCAKYGYSNPLILRDAAKKAVAIVRERFPGRSVLFLGLGGSGAAFATACVLEVGDPDLATMVVTHHTDELQRHVGSNKPHSDTVVVFVDDYVCGGNTLAKAVDALKRSGLRNPEKINLAIAMKATPGLTEEQLSGVELVTLASNVW